MDPKAPLAHCGECPLRDSHFVPGDGPGEADFVIVGEAPGETEVEKGKPFVGRAGVVLDEELRAADIDRSSVYITNTVLCHPEKNKKPPVRAVRACRERLIREIEQRNPKKVLTLGVVATRAVTRESGTIAELRRVAPLRSASLGDGVAIGATYHPGAVLRNPNLRPFFSLDVRTHLDP